MNYKTNCRSIEDRGQTDRIADNNPTSVVLI